MTSCQEHAARSQVVDGAAWMWKPQLIPKEAVSKASRGVEAKSRQIVPGKSKL